MPQEPLEERPLNDPDAQVPDIPDLKQKDKERKRAGAAWGNARAAKTPFSGATGASGGPGGLGAAAGAVRAGAAGAEGAAGSAQGLIGEAVSGAAGSAGSSAGAGWASGMSFAGSWLGTSSASLVSRLMIGAGAAAVLAGVGLYAYTRLHAKPAAADGAGLAPIYDEIKIRRNASDARLQLAAEGAKGELQFDAPPAQEAKAAAEEKPADKAAEKPAENPWGDILSAVQGPQGFAAQNLAGLPSGSSGAGYPGGGLFSSLTGSNSRGPGAVGNPALRYPGQKGKLSGPLARGATRSRALASMRTRNIRSGRAFAQLRYARSQSLIAARGSASEQGMRATAADAFEQNQTQGGQIGPADSPVPTNPGSHGEYGGGTPALLGGTNELPPEMSTPAGAVDPGQKQNYQGPMDAIKQLAAMAGKLKLLSMLLIAIGVALIAAGCAMTPVGWGLIAAGIALVAMGIYMLMMANQMGAQAKAMGDQLQAAYGQEYQKENVDACVSQAIANGTSPDACQSPNPDPHYGDSASDASGVQKAVKDERSSNWEYEDGQPASER